MYPYVVFGPPFCHFWGHAHKMHIRSWVSSGVSSFLLGGLLWFYYVFAKHPCYHCLGRRTTKLNYHLCISQKMILNVPNHCDPRARFGPLLVSRGLDQNLIMY
jgi:hypothetical protein